MQPLVRAYSILTNCMEVLVQQADDVFCINALTMDEASAALLEQVDYTVFYSLRSHRDVSQYSVNLVKDNVGCCPICKVTRPTFMPIEQAMANMHRLLTQTRAGSQTSTASSFLLPIGAHHFLYWQHIRPYLTLAYPVFTVTFAYSNIHNHPHFDLVQQMRLNHISNTGRTVLESGARRGGCRIENQSAEVCRIRALHVKPCVAACLMHYRPNMLAHLLLRRVEAPCTVLRHTEEQYIVEHILICLMGYVQSPRPVEVVQLLRLRGLIPEPSARLDCRLGAIQEIFS